MKKYSDLYCWLCCLSFRFKAKLSGELWDLDFKISYTFWKGASRYSDALESDWPASAQNLALQNRSEDPLNTCRNFFMTLHIHKRMRCWIQEFFIQSRDALQKKAKTLLRDKAEDSQSSICWKLIKTVNTRDAPVILSQLVTAAVSKLYGLLPCSCMMQVWSLQGSAQMLSVTSIENAGADKQDL